MLSHDFLCTLSPNVLPKELRSDHPVVLKSLQTTRDCNVTTVRTNLIPRLIQEFKGSLGENPSVDSLIANWDTPRSIWTMLVASYHGILRSKQDQMLASSSGTSQNILKHHIYTVTAKPSSKKLKRQSTLSSPPSPSKTLALAGQHPVPASTQSSIVGKFSKKHLKQGSPDKFLKVIPLFGETSKRSHVRAKGFCLCFVHQGVNEAI